MPVIHAPAVPTHELPGTRFTALTSPSRGAVDLCVWRVEISPSTQPTPHQVTREEVFVVLSGRARVRIADERYEASAGDAIVVPPSTDFELANAGDEPLTALCCLPVGGQARLANGELFTPPWAE
jgi:mannose-6-phosphate isomerase-like protein (cupin superfamily)